MYLRSRAAVFIAASVLAVTSFLVVSCSPALEKPSTAKKTAESPSTAAEPATPDSAVQFIDCVGTPEPRPTAVTPDCSKPAQQITDITWDTWDDDEASGTGHDDNGDDITVTLSNPANTGTAMVFTVVTVDAQGA